MLSYATKSLLTIAAILLFSTNLRGPFTAVSPLLETIRESLHMSSTQIGWLMTIPLLAFCVVSPLSSIAAKKYGLEKTLFTALLILIAGICVRSSGITAFLFIGTGIIGAGIAIGNTLLPSLLKRDFPNQITSLTSAYAIMMGLASAVGSAIVVPISEAYSWHIALFVFILLPLLSIILWLPLLKMQPHLLKTSSHKLSTPIWKSGLAWVISIFLGMISLIYYTITAWLPSLLIQFGFTASEAGNLHGLMQLATALSGIAILALVKIMSDQRVLSVLMAACISVAMLGLVNLPALATVWVFMFGFGTGGAFILGLSFLGLRTSSSQQSVSLSGMAQSCGYMMAAIGPILAGKLYDVTHSWSILIDITIGLSVILAILGLFAGRNVQIK